MRVLLAGPIIRIEFDSLRGIVFYTRLSEPFSDLEQARRLFEEIMATVTQLPTKQLSLLVDLRSGPGRNDPEFEQLTGKVHGRLVAMFRKCAVVVRTAAGRLQVQRLSGHARNLSVFLDDEKAIAFLSAR